MYAVLLLVALSAGASALLGKPAPDFPEVPAGRWVQGGPLALGDLRGKVVLIRFFTDPSCPYCTETAPALRNLHEDFASRGLVVVGVFTPKPKPRELTPGEALRAARDHAFEFPILADPDWAVLRALWLDRVRDAEYTSSSLLVDREGVVRRVHEGGSYSEKDVRDLRAAIEKLL